MQEEMSDSEMWKAVKEQRQKQHSEWKELNTDTISKSGIPYRLGGREALLFTEEPERVSFLRPIRFSTCFDIFPSLMLAGLPIREPSIEEFLTLLANGKIK